MSIGISRVMSRRYDNVYASCSCSFRRDGMGDLGSGSCSLPVSLLASKPFFSFFFSFFRVNASADMLDEREKAFAGK